VSAVDKDHTTITELRCVACGATHSSVEHWQCTFCGDVLDIRYDYAAIAKGLSPENQALRPQGMWRYPELLPVSPAVPRPPQPVGWTPLIDAPRLAAWCGVSRLRLKDEGRNPSASFKDRASAVAVVHARSLGMATLACASTGNAASSLAGMAAGMGLKAVIFIPETAPEPKVAQLLAFGATVVKVRGGYEAAYALCNEACEHWGWYNRNCAINPYLVEGKKTCGLELAEQTVAAPADWVVVSVGDGCTIAGVHKGFVEMKRIGMGPEVPRMLGVQANGARPIVDAFEAGEAAMTPCDANTVADSISVGTPRNDRKALLAVRQSEGHLLSVSDEAILESVATTPRLSGVFGEPAGVAGVAGLRVAVQEGIVSSDASVIVVMTGSGLKDTQSARKAVGDPLTTDPNLKDLEELLNEA
jgi:threonine synthase